MNNEMITTKATSFKVRARYEGRPVSAEVVKGKASAGDLVYGDNVVFEYEQDVEYTHVVIGKPLMGACHRGRRR